MDTRFGNFDVAAGSTDHHERLTFFDTALDLRWVHCSETARFMGGFYAAKARADGLDPREAEHGIAYLVNEILENVVKFREPGAGAVTIASRLHDGGFELRTSNIISHATSARFQAILVDLLARDPGELLIERIEANAVDPEAGGSGLGILSLMGDYGAQLGWRFVDAPGGRHVALHTFASLRLT